MLFSTRKALSKSNCVSVGVYVCVSFGNKW